MRGRKRQRKKMMKAWKFSASKTMWDVLQESKIVFGKLLMKIKIAAEKI